MGKLTKEQRQRRREEKRAWENATAARLPGWLGKRFIPLLRRLDLFFIDYGFLREVYFNRHQISDGIWRSAQPAPRHLRWAARQGVNKVLNLRATESLGAHHLEREACSQLGINMVDLRVKSRAAPTREGLEQMRREIAAIDGPTLIHCKSGSDRTGLFCALYLALREEVPVAEARRQLGLRYGHFRITKTGVLDHLFDQYLDYAARSPISFPEWLDTVYDPDELTASFKQSRWHRRLARALGFA
jgi:protein tyrosine/serine phosphatase